MKTFTASAPGSLMLMGEHAVLYGRSALAAAIDQRIFVTVQLRDDHQVSIHSELGHLEITRTQLSIQKPFEFVIATILQTNISHGLTIDIKSDFSHTMGLGSSAAVTVATAAALALAQGEMLDQYAVFTRALKVIHAVQKRGSGADVAASVYGGIVEYHCADVPSISKLIFAPEISAVFCGYKKPTTEVIALVREAYEKNPSHYEKLFTKIDDLVHEASNAIQHQDWKTLGHCFNEQQTLMQALGVSDDHLDTLIAELRAQPNILGAKISGSGLGDCVIGVGNAHLEKQIPTSISIEGLRYE